MSRTSKASCFVQICGLIFVYALVAVMGSFYYTGEFMIEGNTTLTVNPDVLVKLTLKQDSLTIGTIQEAVLAAECRIIGDETTCWCGSGYVWTDAVVDEYSSCLNQAECVANISHYTPLCIPKVSIQLEGTMSRSTTYSGWTLSSLNSTLAAAFNTMNGFESLTTTLSDGWNAEFEVYISVIFKTTKLTKVIDNLKYSQGASITVETTGLAEMFSPQHKIDYKVSQVLNCTIDDTLSSCRWFISKDQGITQSAIGNGTQIEVGSWCSNVTKLSLLQTTGLWEGIYTCKFTDGSISHKATGLLKIALLPDEITLTSNPQTVDCSSSPPSVDLKIVCGILTTSEEYLATLDLPNLGKNMKLENPVNKSGKLLYSKTLPISCQNTVIKSVEAICQFENDVHQKVNQRLTIPILYATDKYCDQDGHWPKTKAGSAANGDCPPGRVGYTSRKCEASGWGTVLDYCVNEAINKLSDSMKVFQLGLNATPEVAVEIFSGLKNNSLSSANMSLGDVQATIGILDGMANASSILTLQDDSMMNDFIDSASNILSTEWTGDASIAQGLSTNYIKAVEGLVTNMKVNQSDGHNSSNVQFQVCRNDDTCNRTVFGVEMALSTTAQQSKVLALRGLADRLPNSIKIDNNDQNTESVSIVVSATLENASDHKANITLVFPFNKTTAPQKYKIFCVFWQTNESRWSNEGCVQREEGDNIICECNHLTSFSSLMSKEAVDLPLLEELTYIGLGISICSLLVFLFIECLVWSAIVKSNLAHFRHTSLVNIAVCLLVADCSFLASAFPDKIGKLTCLLLVLAKHFFFMAMFFWMLCLSLMLLHQLIFVFSPLRKKVFMILSFTIGYGGPTVVVGVSYVYYDKVSESTYHNPETCWLWYKGPMEGSLHAFLFPVGVITLMNLVSMVVVIMTLLRPKVSEGKADDKETAKSILKAIVFLTPIFGGTWILGFFSFSMEKSTLKTLLDYAFTIVNSLQGFFILVTGCLGEKKVREEVLKYILGSKSAKSESKQNLTSSVKK